ncbi:hypothetical protein RchiOBHm_Chr3g0483311 [Rosa chinensis]|uniref:Uncharacterized protein n=1 Tax=Rosa chinensis TaxID=74649 RepID=A0A2P6REF5_ROSCH|nr:hypothetical protein RchiOBHm_Chr3g0483311 [Rosa chinensis]
MIGFSSLLYLMCLMNINSYLLISNLINVIFLYSWMTNMECLFEYIFLGPNLNFNARPFRYAIFDFYCSEFSIAYYIWHSSSLFA